MLLLPAAAAVGAGAAAGWTVSAVNGTSTDGTLGGCAGGTRKVEGSGAGALEEEGTLKVGQLCSYAIELCWVKIAVKTARNF